MSARRIRNVAVLGGGITGSVLALLLARGGRSVTVFDQASGVMSAASRWNEGKVHLGFLYAVDASLRTAAELIAGGLSFRPLVEELVGCSIADATTPEDDIYLVHPDSVVDAAAMERYFRSVADLVLRQSGGQYLASIGGVRRLNERELRGLAASAVRAGFRVPERSVNTVWLADRFGEAVTAERRIRLMMGTHVRTVESVDGAWSGPWRIRCEPDHVGQFDAVVNALWEGRLAVDLSLGLQPEPGWSHRFRVSLFVETRRRLGLPSVVLATGPFGDVKNYDGFNFYLSWYPAGLMAQGENVLPPKVSLPSPAEVIEAVRDGLTAALPSVGTVFEHAKDIQVAGGWVFALGRGSLADPSASLHRRDRFGIRREGTYYSVDTGKYSVGPLLARRIADELLAG